MGWQPSPSHFQSGKEETSCSKNPPRIQHYIDWQISSGTPPAECPVVWRRWNQLLQTDPSIGHSFALKKYDCVASMYQHVPVPVQFCCNFVEREKIVDLSKINLIYLGFHKVMLKHIAKRLK